MSDSRVKNAIAALLMYGDNFTEIEMQEILQEAGIQRYQTAYFIMMGFLKPVGTRGTGLLPGPMILTTYEVSEKGKELLK